MKKGQSITEYSLALGLVGLAAIGSMVLLGNGLQLGLNSVIPGQTSGSAKSSLPPASTPALPQTSAPTAQVVNASVLPGNGAGLGGVVPPPVKGQQQACLGSGICVNVPVVANNTKVDVIGGNGAEITLQLAETLRQLAEQLAQDPKDEGLASLISQLANAGHDIGFDLQNYTSYCDPANKSKCKFDNSSKKGNQNMGALGAAEREFDTLFNQILQQNMDSDIKGIITQAGKQINTITDGLSFVQDGSDNSMQVNNDARLIHMDANTICKTGGSNCTVTLPDSAQTATARQ